MMFLKLNGLTPVFLNYGWQKTRALTLLQLLRAYGLKNNPTCYPFSRFMNRFFLLYMAYLSQWAQHRLFFYFIFACRYLLPY